MDFQYLARMSHRPSTMHPIRSTGCLPVYQNGKQEERFELKCQHAPTKRLCLSRSRLRIARSSLRQAGGSSNCFHGAPSSIDGVAVR